jgi:tetratricopeptide (TPR) repeat protein
MTDLTRDEVLAGALAEFCNRLYRLHREATGPAIDSLTRTPGFPLGRSQIYDVLRGRIRQPPSWEFVRAFVVACDQYAHSRAVRLTYSTDLTVWRASHAALDQAADRQLARQMSRPVYALPPDDSSFVGRERELALIQEVQESDRRGLNAAVVVNVNGMPGMGKTTLAVHAGHLLSAAFPDGQLFVPLHAYTSGRSPMSPLDVLGDLLLSLGTPAQTLPASLDGRASLWRTQVAGRRLLIVLDDAAESDQFAPLVPASPHCLLIVTSRRRLTTMPTTASVTLEALTPLQSVDLFTRVSGQQLDGAQDRSVSDIVERCGHLPLAIVLVAGKLRSHPAWDSAHLNRELSRFSARLGMPGAQEAIAASFDLSFESLTAAERRFFVTTALHPGADFDLYAVAALSGTDLAYAAARLEALYSNSLLIERSAGRYAIHDLLREYANRLVSDAGTETGSAAQGRLLDYYVASATSADAVLSPRPEACVTDLAHEISSDVETPDFTNRSEATRWLEAENKNLQASVKAAIASGRPTHAVAVSMAMHTFLHQVGPWDQMLELHQLAATASLQLADRRLEGIAQLQLGTVHYLRDEYAEAKFALETALEIFNGLDDRHRRPIVLGQLGITLRLDGELISSESLLAEALTEFAAIGDIYGRATTLVQSAVTHRFLGDLVSADEELGQALALFDELDDPRGRSMVLNEQGAIWYLMGRYRPAIDVLTSAFDLQRDLMNPLGAATSLNYLGEARRLAGQHAEAMEASDRARLMFRALGERLGEADATEQLAVAQYLSGRQEAALASFDRALALFRELGNLFGEAATLKDLAQAQAAVQGRPAAIESLEVALSLFDRVDYGLGQAETHNALGSLLLAEDLIESALSHYEAAGRHAERLHVPLEEARAQEGLSACLDRRGDHEAAGRARDRAQNIYRMLAI